MIRIYFKNKVDYKYVLKTGSNNKIQIFNKELAIPADKGVCITQEHNAISIVYKEKDSEIVEEIRIPKNEFWYMTID